MVFFPINRKQEEYIAFCEADVPTKKGKLQNSPCSICECSFITFRREVIGIRRKTTQIKVIYNANQYSTTTLVVLGKIYQINHSMVAN